MTIIQILPILFSGIAVLISLGTFLQNRRKPKVDKANIESIYEELNTDQALKIKNLETELKDIKENQIGLQRALNERDEYIIVLLDGNCKLSKQLQDCEQTPCWEPPKPAFLYKLNGSRVNGTKL